MKDRLPILTKIGPTHIGANCVVENLQLLVIHNDLIKMPWI